MSGGSFEYLCFDDAGDLLSKYRDGDSGDLAAMRDALSDIGAVDAAMETETLRLDVRAFRIRIDAKIRRLSDIWKAVEWQRSGDSGPEDVTAAINKYRGGE